MFQNKIYSIKNDRGEKLEVREFIEAILNSHFSDILTDPRRNRLEYIETITIKIMSLVSDKQNHLLMKTITLQEVQEAVFQMKVGTPSSLDGFGVNCFHHFWEMVKLDVWKIVEQSRISGRIFPALNATFLTMIPKCDGADTPDKFRPICLCNVIYKIITKVIANRLKPILPYLISLE